MDGNIRELFSKEVQVVPEYNVKVDVRRARESSMPPGT